MTGFSDQTFEVLQALSDNNSKEWYDANRDRLQTHARAPFEAMLRTVSMLLEGSKYPMSGSKKTMFRQNRDVRFSKDKTLYKTTVSGMITPSGTKTEMGGVVYAQVGPKGGWMAAGFYKLSTSDLGLMRDAIIADPDAFARIRDGLTAKGWPLRFENTLRTMPRGYAQHENHSQADALRLKSYVVSADQPKAVWTSGDIVEKMVELAETIGPLLAFGRDALQRAPN